MLTPAGRRPTGYAQLAVRATAFWPSLVVLALGCLAYAGAAGIWFLKDDLAMSTVTDAAGRPDFATFFRNFVWPAAMPHDQFYRPLPILLGWFDLTVFGADPGPFRIANIGFHGLNGALVGILVNQLTRFRRPAAGWFAGAIFALHPLHGEAVLWVTQRMVVICATFSLLALIALECWIERRRRGAAVTAILAALAAALCKEVTVTLPAAMVVMAFTAPTPAGESRWRRTAVVAGCGALLSAGMLVLRRVVFGVWAGTYGGLSLAEYADRFRVFERLPRSLLHGLWAVNPLEVPERARVAFGVAWLAFLALAVWRLIPALTHPPTGRAAVVFATFALASFIPTLGIFFIEPSLTNGRFLYQPLAGLLSLLMLGFTRPARRQPLLKLLAPAALTILFSLAGQLNLRAFHGADAQIRAVRGAIIREAGQSADAPLIVVYRSPMVHHGVVTLDLSLRLAMLPPFTPPPGIDVFPFVAGQDLAWPAQVPELRRWTAERPGRRVVHLACDQEPVWVSALFGDLDPPAGAAPPEILAPGDGAVLVHPDEDPTFVLRIAPEAVVVRLRLEIEGARVVIELDPARHLRRVGTRREYRFQNGCVRATASSSDGATRDIPDPWAVWAQRAIASPLPIVWRVDALDARGRMLGRSEERSLVLLTSRPGG